MARAAACPVKYGEFETLAHAEWARVPDPFKAGIDGLIIERDAKASPGRNDTWTLGECVTETWPSDFDGPDTVRSNVVLYYGSFRRLAAHDPTFHWEEEIWETLTHELRHHLESLADRDELGDVDAGMEEHFRRHDGETFEPFYFRLGEPHADGWYRLEHAWFCETRDADGEFVRFRWKGRDYRIEAPDTSADVLYMDIEAGVHDAAEEMCVVVIRSRSFGATLRAAIRREPLRVEEVSVIAESVD
jgi:hypothetical protein